MDAINAALIFSSHFLQLALYAQANYSFCRFLPYFDNCAELMNANERIHQKYECIKLKVIYNTYIYKNI